MGDRKSQISYNYNPSYHSYAYGLMYPPGSEQNHGNMAGWGDAGVTDLSNYNAGMTPAYYAAAAGSSRTRDEYHSPDQHEVNAHCSYQGSGLVYFGDSQAGRLVMSGQHRAGYEAQDETRLAWSDSTSDSEPLTSPDSWSSGSSRETSLPQADPAIWVKTESNDGPCGSSSDASEDVSSSLVEGPSIFAVNGSEGADNITTLHAPLPATKKPKTTAANNPKTTAANNPKVKVRVAFSASQMETLVERFSVQRYLTPAEMKDMAEVIGLTYKQVKTWFQNRRMKLRRHHKDSSWVTERYNNRSPMPGTMPGTMHGPMHGPMHGNMHGPMHGPMHGNMPGPGPMHGPMHGNMPGPGPMHGNMYPNIPSHIQPYQGEVRPQFKEHYNQHMTPQNLAFYLAAMGSAAGPSSYPAWCPGPSQMAMPSRPQAAGWSMPPGANHYDYNAVSASTSGQDRRFDSNDKQESLSAAAAP